ncbi:RNase adapter RapZ [Candidatus Odyssella thessalonicensis]|uniref:RNase adapter RapZ n=1 Tax=Candidatus Odyssella thessalonicensis TaxID=84647 RepID=UPI000225A969|nr:RNase adapter RapZ [Candidatus Odyssella thessalonicensis]
MRNGQNKTADFIFITGMSGAGRSTALKVFEDLGYVVIDNLPQYLFSYIQSGALAGKLQLPLVIGVDVRTLTQQVDSFLCTLKDLRQTYKVKLLYLECQDDVLLKRYNISRHRHPYGQKTLEEGIHYERVSLAPLNEAADHVIDTSLVSVITLGRVLKNIFVRSTSPKLQIRLISFSYRKGLPSDADIVWDARFLENPHYEESLKHLTGQDEFVAKFLLQDPLWHRIFHLLEETLGPTLAGFKNSGRSYLTIACGCTGGQHRSVFMVEQLAEFLEKNGEEVMVEHRELSR